MKIVDQYKKIPEQVKAVFYFVIASFLQRGISLVTTPIFTRILTTSEYGQFSVFNSWLGIFTCFVTLNLYSGVFTQGMAKFEDRRLQYASTLQGLCFTLVLLWGIIYCVFRHSINRMLGLTTLQMLAMLILIWTTAIFQFWSVEQRYAMRYRTLIIISVAVSIVKPCVGVAFVIFARDKVTARIIGLVIVELVFFVWMFFSQIVRGKRFFDLFFWRYAFLFALPLVPHYLSGAVLSGFDRIMIRNFVGNEEAGIYSLAYSLSQIMTIFNTALWQTIEPWLYKKIKTNQLKDIASIGYVAFMIIAFMNILLIALAPEAVAIFAPAAYYDAIWVIPPVSMSVYFSFLYVFFAVFEFYYEKKRYIVISTGISAVLNIVLNYIFIKLFGYYAAGYTTLFCYIIFSLSHYVFMKKICKNKDIKVPYNSGIVLGISAIFMIIGFLFLICYNNRIVRYCLSITIILSVLFKRKQILFVVKNVLKERQELSEK